jgi:hypothetical protein
MLVKRTKWLKRFNVSVLGNDYFGDYSKFGDCKMRVCFDAVSKFWEVPENANWARFYVYDTPTRKSTPVQLRYGTFFSYYLRKGLYFMMLEEYMSSKVLDRLFARQQIYHVECEYSC